MTRRITHMTLEGGVLFFEDGTEVSGVSVEMLTAVPELLEALELLLSYNTSAPRLHNDPHVDFERRQQKARAAIAKAKGENK
jgi:hypothetical protein